MKEDEGQPVEPKRRRTIPLNQMADAGAVDVEPAEPPATAEAAATSLDRMLAEPMQLPTLPRAYQGIVDTVMTLPEIDVVFAELKAGLEVKEALTPGVIEDALNRSSNQALRAHQLYVVMRAAFERYEWDMTAVKAKMRRAATEVLSAEKKAGTRTKQITEADIDAVCAEQFPDEWAAALDQHVRARKTLEHAERLSKLWEDRQFSLSAMLNKRRV